MNKSVIQLVALIAGCVALFFIGQNLISDHQVPSLGDFLASSTEEFASSTEEFASSTGMMASSTAEVASSTVALENVSTTTDIQTPNGTIQAIVADTDASREQGLSDRPSLPSDEGMLFVFDSPGVYAFWMKDMHFPLDMVWINADKTVIGVTKDLAPATYPSTFPPPSPVSYVLEINAGDAQRLGLVTGAVVGFDLSKE